MSDTITCPKCKAEIKLTESLAAPLIESTRRQYEQRIADKEAEVAGREAAIREQQAAVLKEKQAVDAYIAEKLNEQRPSIAAEEAKKARLLLGQDLDTKAQEVKELQEVLRERDEKLAQAQSAQAELMRKQRELDDAKREMELTVEKRVQESLATERDKAKREAEDGLKLKVLEKEQTIASMQKQIEQLQRKAEQGSQQAQGEVMEVELEDMLRRAFPFDTIDPVPKGVHGGDVLHHVRDSSGTVCGTILWESKRTKAWSDGWLPKLRDDQRAAKAQVAVLASTVLPKAISTFDCVEGVWVTNRSCILGLASVLRAGLIDVNSAKRSLDGRQSKIEILYNYLSSADFRHRIEGIVEAFMALRKDLEKEKRSMQLMWAKREKQLERAVTNTSGFYGDLSGIVGAKLPRIEPLELPAIESGDDLAEETSQNDEPTSN